MKTRARVLVAGLLPTALCLLISLAVPGASRAAMCSLDDVPGATLLLPYFEVDWMTGEAGGVNTVFSINNASPEPTVAHVTLWTDWSQPTIGFDVFLTGYDVQAVSLQDVFLGNLPVTADTQNDPEDAISPHGQNPPWDGAFENCEVILPFVNPVVPPVLLERLRDGHTGQDVLGQGCMGSDTGDLVARGYITIDAANACSVLFPYESGYFVDGGSGVASNRNVLWGSFRILDPLGDTVFGDSLVSVEAADDFDDQSTATGYTFYGRFTQNGADNREPLANVWASEFSQAGETATELLVWRDSTSADHREFFPCGGSGPSWAPLEENEIVAFDQEENAIELCWGTLGVPHDPPAPAVGPCLTLETQRAALEGDLEPPFAHGWMAFNLNTTDDAPLDDADFGAEGRVHQAWVGTVTSHPGQIAVGYAATVLGSACDDADPRIGETGDIGISTPEPAEPGER